MSNTILNSLKGFVVAAVILSVPTFAVCALVANSSNRSNVQLASEHDPLCNGFRVVEPIQTGRAAVQVAAVNTVEEVDLRTWTYTWGTKGTTLSKGK